VSASENPSVLILTGPPGAGKTTAGAVLGERFPRAVHLEADLFFSFIRSGHIEPWKPESHEQNRVVMRIVAEAAAGYAAAGYFTIVDGIVIPGWFLEPLRDALREAGHRVAFAVLRAPLPVCLGRLREREGDPPIEDGAIAQLWENFADLGAREAHALDLEEESPEEAADLLERGLASGRLTL
jgi:tRNA uridine 5-carbamoylmethylation protein Kti12